MALELAIPHAIVSAYMHGCAFLTVTKDSEGIIITAAQRRIQCGRLGWTA